MGLHLKDVVRIMFHAFFLLVYRLEEVGNLLDSDFVLALDSLDHSLLEQLRNFVGQSLEALYVIGEHCFFAVVG